MSTSKCTFGLSSGLLIILVGLTLSQYTYAQDAQILTGPEGDQYDFVTNGVLASSDQYLVIGAIFDSEIATSSGAAYIYRYDGTEWTDRQRLVASDATETGRFGHAASVDGEYALVGAAGAPGESSRAYVFRNNGTEWVEEAKLEVPGGIQSVALSGDVALIGMSEYGETAENAGGVFVFRRDGDNWTEEQKLLASDGTEGDRFGFSVAIEDDQIFVGARSDDDPEQFSGSVYVFDLDGDQWTEGQKLQAGGVDGYDFFGEHIAIENDVLVVGAPIYQTEANGPMVGAAFVFGSDGGNWQQEQLLTASDAGEDDFGDSVSIHGNLIVVGAPKHSADGVNRSGAAYVFEGSGGSWNEVDKLVLPDLFADAYFGVGVAVTGDHVHVASDRANSLDEKGAVFVFDRAAIDTQAEEHPMVELSNVARLNPGYPNPFRTSTTMSYVVREPGPVTLRVFDVLGREVALLVDEHTSPGSYSSEWTAGNLPAGLYICRLTVGDHSEASLLIHRD